jgi:hypothetical protein
VSGLGLLLISSQGNMCCLQLRYYSNLHHVHPVLQNRGMSSIELVHHLLRGPSASNWKIPESSTLAFSATITYSADALVSFLALHHCYPHSGYDAPKIPASLGTECGRTGRTGRVDANDLSTLPQVSGGHQYYAFLGLHRLPR